MILIIMMLLSVNNNMNTIDLQITKNKPNDKVNISMFNSDFNRYINKEVGIFLDSELRNKFSREIWLNEPPCVLIGKGYDFSKKGVYVKIYIYSPQYLKEFNCQMNWSNELFKKEKIRKIVIYENNKMINTFGK
jgi:hypothetical protein